VKIVDSSFVKEPTSIGARMPGTLASILVIPKRSLKMLNSLFLHKIIPSERWSQVGMIYIYRSVVARLEHTTNTNENDDGNSIAAEKRDKGE
jgi:hypothetical protein